jgi:hypothetical protein
VRLGASSDYEPLQDPTDVYCTTKNEKIYDSTQQKRLELPFVKKPTS